MEGRYNHGTVEGLVGATAPRICLEDMMQATVDDFTSVFDFPRKAIVLAIMADPDRPEPVGRSPWGTIFAYPEGSFEDAVYPVEYLQRVAERVIPADAIGVYGPCDCCQPYDPDRCGSVWYPGWPDSGGAEE